MTILGLAALALALAHVAVQMQLRAVPLQMPTVAQAMTVVAPQARYAAQMAAAQPAIVVLLVTSALSWLLARCMSSMDIQSQEKAQLQQMPRLSNSARQAMMLRSAKPARPPLANVVVCQIVPPASCKA